MAKKKDVAIKPAGDKEKPGGLQNKAPIKDKSLLFGGHRIQKGQVLNPGGRPKMEKTVRALAREYTEVAIRTLAEIMQDTESAGPSRVAAATALIDRGWGKPLQQVEIGEAGAFTDMDDAALDRYIQETSARLAMLAPPDEEERVH
jgi:hypothetical protein